MQRPPSRLLHPSTQPPRGRRIQPIAAYRETAALLRGRIEQGEWKKGGSLPSLRNLAAELNTGVNVVRQAVEVLRQEQWLSVSARRRVLVNALEAPHLSPGAAILQVVGDSIQPFVKNPYGWQLQRGLITGAGELGLPLTILHAYGLREGLPLDFLDQPVRGILLFGPLRKAVLARYAKLRIPVILLDQPPEQTGLSAVCVDNETSAFEAVTRLVNWGHRRIAFLRHVWLKKQDIEPDSKERQRGYMRALKGSGLRYDRSLIFNSFSKDIPSSAAYRAILEPASRITAVVCASAGLARLIRESARAARRSIPSALSIVCWSDRQQVECSGPAIDFEDLGRRAVLMLREPFVKPKVIRVPAPWRDAGTAGPAPKRGRP